MKKYTQPFIYSVVLGLVHASYIFSKPACEGEGLGCMAIDFTPILAGLIFIPLTMAIIGFVSSKDKKIAGALTWFGIAFLVVFILDAVARLLK